MHRSVPSLVAALSLGVLAGPFTALLARPTQAAPKRAACAVCSVTEGAGPEAVKATASYQGKEYYFCREECKAEFLKDPSRYLLPELPFPAPAFALKDLAGTTHRLSDFSGKVVLVDFWATFCGPCIQAMPALNKLHAANAAKGFSVVGIATDEEGQRIVAPFMAKRKLSYPILVSDADTWKKYGVETLPALFLIDRTGKVVKRFGGGTKHKEIEQAVRQALGE